ncbi:Cysteine-rich receptor-like protein kinase [Gossypium australe]|uniref:Cysteine-rich receptor-like protein kinase n=1 Tax=Gossypium australe TaxID=47621 RepID=A0A5B6VVF9_9ROSI|nr:Cysteine-rich receptor-like protein kinase [Gossypium australe]
MGLFLSMAWQKKIGWKFYILDVKTINSKAILKTCYNVEAIVANTYTRKMFLEFQKELFFSQSLKIVKLNENGVKRYIE